MGVTTYTQELTSPIAPSRMFKALILDSNKLLPQLLPQVIENVHVIEGNGGAAGSIERINFTQQSGLKYVKNRIEVVDKENLVCKYSLIEGDALGDKLECIAHEVKFEKGSNGECICKMTSKYHGMGEYEIKEEELKARNDKSLGIYKIVETYLLENPNVYA